MDFKKLASDAGTLFSRAKQVKIMICLLLLLAIKYKTLVRVFSGLDGHGISQNADVWGCNAGVAAGKMQDTSAGSAGRWVNVISVRIRISNNN